MPSLIDRISVFQPCFGGVALVHAIEIAGEQGGLVAAGAGADFEDGAVVVHRILGQQRETDLVAERFLARLGLVLFLFGQFAHVAVAGGVVDQRLQIGNFGVGGAIGLDLVHHRPELGEFARQLHVVVGGQIGGELAFQHGVPVEQGIELLLR